MPKRWLRSVSGLLLCLMSLSGCVETALIGLGAGGAMAGYKWMEGNLIREYPRSLAELEPVVQKVCKQFRIKITERTVSPIKATIVGIDPNGDEVKINMEGQPNNITSVGVRVGGFMGNKEASEMFHNQLAKELGL